MDLRPRLFAARKRGEKDTEIFSFYAEKEKLSCRAAVLCTALGISGVSAE